MNKQTDEQFAEAEKKIAEVKASIKKQFGIEPAGAEKCGNCGHEVIAMLKTPEHEDKGMTIPTVYEVGCIVCPPFYVKHADGHKVMLDGKAAKVKRRSYSARDFSVAGAVAKWNDGNHVEDYKLELNVPAHEKARLG